MRRWIAHSQPYAVYSYGREWLPFRVRVAGDVTGKLLRRMWTNRRRGKR